MKTIVLVLLAWALPAQVSESRWNYIPMRGQEFTGIVFTFENPPSAMATVDIWAAVDGDPVHLQRTFKTGRSPADPRASCLEMNLGRDPLRFHVKRIAIAFDGLLWTFDKPLAGRLYAMKLP